MRESEYDIIVLRKTGGADIYGSYGVKSTRH